MSKCRDVRKKDPKDRDAAQNVQSLYPGWA
jgi:hypothetical protein